jgi:hypothetical protein
MKRGYSLGRVCGCGNPVSNKAKSGLCRPCFMARLHSDPERGKKVSEGIRKWLENPDNRARHRAAAKRAGITKRMNPEFRAKAAKTMREIAQPICVATGLNMRRDWRKMRKLALEARWAWCPPEYRDAYRAIRDKGILAGEAKRILAEQIKADLAKLSPFERQMRALERGASLVANDPKPIFGIPTITVDNGDKSQIMSKSLTDHGKEQDVNGQEEMAA